MEAIVKAAVTVIIPVYNSMLTIERALASTLEQDVETEVIVVDDNSNDGSAEFIEYLFSEYVGDFKLIRSTQSLGASGARNLAITQASKKYIAFLDSDDLWLPGKLPLQVKAMENNPNAVLSTTDSYNVTPTGRILSRNHYSHKPASGANAWKALLAQNFIPTPTVMVRTEMVKSVGGFNTDLRIGEDLDLWISLSKTGEIVVSPEVFVHYFDYKNSLMKRGVSKDLDSVMDMIKNHMEDDRLTESERRTLLAKRYYEVGKGMGWIDTNKMNNYFNMAIENGFSERKINRYKLRKAFKNTTGKIAKYN